MKKELDEQLVAAYPKLYRNRNAKPNESCMTFGFCTGDGWFDLIKDLSEKISAIIDSMPEEEQQYHYAAQVKEKFGGLRFYMEGYDEGIQKLIKEAEKKSSSICEDCGFIADANYKPSTFSWIRTLCPACRIKNNIMIGK